MEIVFSLFMKNDGSQPDLTDTPGAAANHTWQCGQFRDGWDLAPFNDIAELSSKFYQTEVGVKWISSATLES